MYQRKKYWAAPVAQGFAFCFDETRDIEELLNVPIGVR
jgi:hypothetical protein